MITSVYELKDGGVVAALTDTRSRDEIEACLSTSMLTAITRAEAVRFAAARAGRRLVDRVYVCTKGDPPQRLLAVLGALGVKLGSSDRTIAPIPAPAEPIEELIAEAFVRLARSVQAAIHCSRPLSALYVLAEADHPERSPNRNHVEYWQRTFEWMALIAMSLVERAPDLAFRLAPSIGSTSHLGDDLLSYARVPFDLALGKERFGLAARIERAIASGSFDELISDVERTLAA